MFNRLKNVEARYEDINEKLMDPAVVSDNQQYMELMKEHKQITPLVEKFREYEQARIAKEEAEEMLQDSDIEKEFKEMCEEEINESNEAIEALTEELQILLLPSDPDDDKNVIIEIVAEQVAMRLLCLQTLFIECIPCMRNKKAGR